MSASEENTEISIPCVLITSCDSGFKEEELIKRKFINNVHGFANRLTASKANLAQQITFGSACLMLVQVNYPFV